MGPQCHSQFRPPLQGCIKLHTTKFLLLPYICSLLLHKSQTGVYKLPKLLLILKKSNFWPQCHIFGPPLQGCIKLAHHYLPTNMPGYQDCYKTQNVKRLNSLCKPITFPGFLTPSTKLNCFQTCQSNSVQYQCIHTLENGKCIVHSWEPLWLRATCPMQGTKTCNALYRIHPCAVKLDFTTFT